MIAFPHDLTSMADLDTDNNIPRKYTKLQLCFVWA
jgi:hypothetical protein